MCADPSQLAGLHWLLCYLSTGVHIKFYQSFLVVIALLCLAAPLALLMGFFGALAKRSHSKILNGLSTLYINMVRGVPDVVFFMFVPLALDQLIEYTRHRTLCPDAGASVFQGDDFVVCAAAKMPLATAEPWVHSVYGFSLALFAFAIVFGAFAANTLDGALRAVPKNQLETARAYGMRDSDCFWRIELPQMWGYALPGLSNLWMILLKATPLLYLLGIEDIVYWANELGASKGRRSAYPHGDWRAYYFAALLVFYLLMTWGSERVFSSLDRRVNRSRLAHD